MSDLTKNIKWQAEAAMHSVVARFLRLVSPPTVFKCGEFVGKMIWPFMRNRQRSIERNLRIATCGSLSIKEARALGKRSFIRTSANLLSSSFSKDLSDAELGEMLSVENPELLEKAYAKGTGVVLLLAHMGNWELLTRMHRFFPAGAKSGAFYRPLNNPVLDKRVRKQREADGTRLFSKRDSLHNVSGYLRDGAIIGILTDQRVGRQGELVEFFGRITRASPLPSLMVRRCKSEVLALSLKTVSPGKWIATYHPVERPYNTTNCMAALEKSMSSSMEDVFWLQERWRMYLRSSRPPQDWLQKEGVHGRKAHRAVIWASSGEKDNPLPDGYDHGDIDYEYVIDKEPRDLPDIDEKAALPIDFILAFSESTELKKEASKLGIPVMFAGNLSK
ncbi:lysophospholipid acyltransferase family protein [Luteolibacter sp. AS25]|uniref:lysophospholipid acyltransferase family protein n=1 Tax=Luteolibacter sp. AS25 TaxID=3135776 RepID=UPI00398B3504